MEFGSLGSQIKMEFGVWVSLCYPSVPPLLGGKMHSQECAGVGRVLGEDIQVEGHEICPMVRKFSGYSQPSSHEPMLGPCKPLFLETDCFRGTKEG